MSAAQHTPGPWWCSGLEVGTEPMMMVKVANVSGANYQEAQANAHLISAAPELLKALKEIVEFWDSAVPGELVSDMHLNARAAIYKATGGAA